MRATCLIRVVFAQCSDWQRRPLSRAQLTYAAADAACLHALHDGLLRAVSAAGLEPQDVAATCAYRADLKARASEPRPYAVTTAVGAKLKMSLRFTRCGN